MSKRDSEIKGILAKLIVADKNLFAVRENILFFQAVQSVFSYIVWFISHGLRIHNTEQLLEINELFPEYDDAMHRELVAVERRPLPGLIEPLVSRILAAILEQNKDVRIVSLGTGGGEVERQIITRLREHSFTHRVMFLCVDRSAFAHQFATRNLRELEPIVELRTITFANRYEIEQFISNKPFVVIQCQNDIFDLQSVFPCAFFDVGYHSLFKHHLTFMQMGKLDNILKAISQKCFAYDGCRSFLHLIPQTITAWHDPIFLNASVFSNLRYQTRAMLRRMHKGHISFFAAGTYLVEY